MFYGWGGNIPEVQKKTNPLIVLMDSDKSVRADFKRTSANSPSGLTAVQPKKRSVTHAERIVDLK